MHCLKYLISVNAIYKLLLEIEIILRKYKLALNKRYYLFLNKLIHCRNILRSKNNNLKFIFNETLYAIL